MRAVFEIAVLGAVRAAAAGCLAAFAGASALGAAARLPAASVRFTSASRLSGLRATARLLAALREAFARRDADGRAGVATFEALAAGLPTTALDFTGLLCELLAAAAFLTAAFLDAPPAFFAAFALDGFLPMAALVEILPLIFALLFLTSFWSNFFATFLAAFFVAFLAAVLVASLAAFLATVLLALLVTDFSTAFALLFFAAGLASAVFFEAFFSAFLSAFRAFSAFFRAFLAAFLSAFRPASPPGAFLPVSLVRFTDFSVLRIVFRAMCDSSGAAARCVGARTPQISPEIQSLQALAEAAPLAPSRLTPPCGRWAHPIRPPIA